MDGRKGSFVDLEDRDWELDEGARYKALASIQPNELRHAFRRLTLFGDDPYLSMQATNLGVVDMFCLQLEANLLQLQADQEKTPMAETGFLLAQSQMWIFAVYEALRTWRQRANDVIKWSENGVLAQMIDSYRSELGYNHIGRRARASQLEQFQQDPALLQSLRLDLRRVHIPFHRIEHVRMALAKHEVRREKNSVAFAPGYGRINMWCGSIDFELSNDRYIMGFINRRDIADELRALHDGSVPTENELASFDSFMNGKEELPE
jgi:hypothetical protein